MNWELGGKRLLVTGGAGFIGSHLSERLLNEKADVLVVDNYFTGRRGNIAHLLANPSFEAMRHDITFPRPTGSLISPVQRHPYTTSTTPCRRRKSAFTARSTCLGSPSGSERESCRLQRVRSMAIRACIRSPKSIGGTSIRSVCAHATMRESAVQRHCSLTTAGSTTYQSR